MGYRPTDGRTDKASYRDAWTHLKTFAMLLGKDAGAWLPSWDEKFFGPLQVKQGSIHDSVSRICWTWSVTEIRSPFG